MQPIPSDTSSSSVPPLDIKWIPHQPPAPFPSLKNHAAIICDNTMLIFGGFDKKRKKNTMITYDLYTNSLSIVNSAIKPRNGHSATFVPPQSMFIIGGWLNLGPYASDEIFVYDIVEKQFMQFILENNASIGPTNMHTCDYYQKKNSLILFRGGNGIDFFNDLIMIDLKTHKMIKPNTKGKKPSPRANHGSCIINDNYYIFGGWSGVDLLNDLYILDLTTNVWSELMIEVKPSKRAGMTFLNYLDECIVVFGGSTFNANYLNDVWVLDIEQRKWYQVDDENVIDREPPKPVERAGHSAVVYGNSIVIFGGGNSGNYFNDIFILKLKLNTFYDCKIIQNINDDVYTTINNYFDVSNLSDIAFIFIKENKEIKAHRLILSFFSGKLSSLPEGTNKSIIIDKYKYDNFKYVIAFCYGCTEDLNPPESVDDKIEIFRIASEYGITKLKKYFENLLSKSVTLFSFTKIYKSAYETRSVFLIKYCNWFYRQHKKEL